MFLKDYWYVAAWDHEIADGLLARTLLGEPVVLFRTADGTAVALEDHCCHRGLPLSMGKPVGEGLQCGYHGLTFDRTGACVAVPGQSQVPPGASVRAYPLVERWHWLWIWMGDPERADPALIPDWWWLDHPDWDLVKGKHLHIQCHYELITDNLLDLSHLAYVHLATIGTGSITEFPITTEREDDLVRVTRWILDRAPPPLFKTVGGFRGHGRPLADRRDPRAVPHPDLCRCDRGRRGRSRSPWHSGRAGRRHPYPQRQRTHAGDRDLDVLFLRPRARFRARRRPGLQDHVRAVRQDVR